MPSRPKRPSLSARERLLFEAGIKLGGIFHQYLGIPVTPRTAPALARTIASAVELQPFVEKAQVRVDPKRGGPVGTGRYAYRYLTAEMLHVQVTLRDGPESVVVALEYRPELHYPLMHVVRTARARRR
ncbi:MAG: dihydroneopterin aldolase family protein [Thermoplasmata archaeon]|nr:dihydroneopterin aldolase family protein [Thermoplasmata archaeon]MCI4337985.1 dihydroneopterin aldolase family protein [Thermoplasmata archaeon]MCI4341239.1 dihydroneopterin aldolase family protein [Thermoplasmata archaeon]